MHNITLEIFLLLVPVYYCRTCIRTASIVYNAYVWAVFEHQHCGRSIYVAYGGHFVLALFVLARGRLHHRF